MGIDFRYAKPLSLIEYLLHIVQNKEALVLDFFAGSGTTGHAVMNLNKKDGGMRKFILITNNEDNIAERICFDRLNKSINGYIGFKNKKMDGLVGNKMRYLKVLNRNEQEI